MLLERHIYLDTPGIASLYAQLKGEDVVETILSVEQEESEGWKLAIAAFLGVSGDADSSKKSKEARVIKKTLRPENMLREITASLRANGNLKNCIADAIREVMATGEPSWFECRHGFSVPPDAISEMNANRSMIFVSGFPPYEDDPAAPRISMTAGLQNCPEARDGQLGVTGHLARYFRQMGGRPHSYKVFGSLLQAGDDFLIKPYSIRI